MKTKSIIKHALAAAALSPMLLIAQCTCQNQEISPQSLSNKIGKGKANAFQQDAPRQAHALQELSAQWIWETQEGDAASDFAVRIEQASDNEIRIINFLNIDGEAITATAQGDSLKFEGELAGGNLLIQKGTGTITNGWTSIQLEYETFDGESTERQKALLSKGTEI